MCKCMKTHLFSVENQIVERTSVIVIQFDLLQKNIKIIRKFLTTMEKINRHQTIEEPNKFLQTVLRHCNKCTMENLNVTLFQPLYKFC